MKKPSTKKEEDMHMSELKTLNPWAVSQNPLR